MHHVVLGAGAVGGVVGARLHLAGRPVTLVARGAHLDAVRAEGLLLDAADGPHRVHAPVAGGAAEVAWRADSVVLLAVKSHQSADAVADLAVHLPPGVPVVCLQNGVTNEAAVARGLPGHPVHAVTVMLPATHLAPGTVVQKCHPVPGILDVGRWPDGVDAVDEAVAADLCAAGFASVPRPDAMAWKHRKLLLNLGNAVDAAFAPGPDADELERRCRREGEAVLAAAGVAVIGEAADRERRGDLLRRRPDLEPSGSSTWQSLTRGAATEVEELTGHVVALGRAHGVATPANDAVLAAVRGLVRTGGAPRSLEARTALTPS